MQRVSDTIHKVAATDGTVLIQGKAGPERNSSRGPFTTTAIGARAFVAVNCGAIVENLFESDSRTQAGSV